MSLCRVNHEAPPNVDELGEFGDYFFNSPDLYSRLCMIIKYMYINKEK